MNSPILNAAARYVSPLIFAVSIVLLYRGHNMPGGGFIGGLTAAVALLLRDFGGTGFAAVAKDAKADSGGSFRLMVGGLALAGASALWPVLIGKNFFTGLWLPGFSLPLLGSVHLGTPLLFDVGVYLTVIGFAVHTARSLGREEPENAGGEPWS